MSEETGTQLSFLRSLCGSHRTLGCVGPPPGQGSLKQDRRYMVLRVSNPWLVPPCTLPPPPLFFDKVVTDSEVRNTDFYLALLSLFAETPDFVA